MLELACSHNSREIQLVEINKPEFQQDYSNEIWKPVSVNTDYSVSSKGRVRGTKILSPECSDGKYLRVMISNCGVRKHYSVHILVAQAFLEPPTDENCKYVDHIDRNSKNNCYTNLRWISVNDNNNSRNKASFTPISIFMFEEDKFVKIFKQLSKIISDFNLSEEYNKNIYDVIDTNKIIKINNKNICLYSEYYEKNLPTEKWNMIDNLYASSMGRIQTKRGKSCGTWTTRYPRYKEQMVHILVLKAFSEHVPENFLQVDHINGIYHDNRIENLRWVTPIQNSYLGNQTKKKRIIQIKDNIEIAEFDSLKQASLHVGTSPDNIGICLSGNSKSAGGYQWKYSENKNVEIKIELPKIQSTKIIQLSLEKNIIKIFETIQIASDELKIPLPYIRRVCRGDRKSCGGFMFQYE